jgi:hypothetical protein
MTYMIPQDLLTQSHIDPSVRSFVILDRSNLPSAFCSSMIIPVQAYPRAAQPSTHAPAAYGALAAADGTDASIDSAGSTHRSRRSRQE